MQTGSNKQTFQQRLNAPEPVPLWNLSAAAFFVVAYIVIWIASLTIVSTIRGEIDGRVSPNAYLVSAFMAHLVVIVGIVQWSRRRLGEHWQRHLRLETVAGGQIILGLLVGLGVAWLLDLLGSLVGAKEWLTIPPLYAGLIDPAPVTWEWVTGLAAALLIQPIAEALIFAGLLYPIAAQRARNNITAILATSFVFMFMNVFLAVQQGSWFVVAFPLLMGVFMIGVRAYTQSTRLAVAVRMGFGLLIVLISIIQ